MFFIRLVAQCPTVLPPPYTNIRADAARFVLYGWRRDPLLCYPPYTPVGRPSTVLPPYTAPGLNAACFGAMSIGVFGEPLLFYPLHIT